MFIGGIIGLIIFGPASVVLFFKLFDKKPGLIIDEKGITDNSNTSSIGLIKWSEITRISQTESNSIKFLVVELENPEEFFEKLSLWKKLSSRQNLKQHGTPITLSSVSLQCTFAELEKMVMGNYKKFRKNNKSPYEARN